MRKKTPDYTGRENLKKLVKSTEFQDYFKSLYGLHQINTWHKVIGVSVDMLMKGLKKEHTTEKALSIKRINSSRYQRMLQESKPFKLEDAVKVIALVQVFLKVEYPLASGDARKIKEKWDNNIKFYKLDSSLINRYFKKSSSAGVPVPAELLKIDGNWVIYFSHKNRLARGLLRIDTNTKEYRFYLGPDRVIDCSISSTDRQGSMELSAALPESNRSFRLKIGTQQVQVQEGIRAIKGIAESQSTHELHHLVVLLVHLNSKLQPVSSELYGRLDSEVASTALYPGEENVLVYYQLLLDNGLQYFNDSPRESLIDWLKPILEKAGRNNFNINKALFENQKWFSLSRHSEDNTLILFSWNFRLHHFKNSITAVRKQISEPGTMYPTLTGELRFFNNRFWIDFTSANEHKTMFLRYDSSDMESGPHFLAMGSSIDQDHPNDLGDMVTEILIPANKLPKVYSRQPSITYDEFKHLHGISIDLKLYLNHRDHNILSFEDPDSLKSKLSKQKDAIPFQGNYLVYLYNRYAQQHQRLVRYTLEIDQLAVASLRKKFRSEPEKTHLFKGLAEEFNDNLHVIFEHDKTTGVPDEPQKLLQEIQLMVDCTPVYEDLNLLTGVLSDTDYAQNPRSMACVLVKIEGRTVADEKREKLVKVALQNGEQPQPYCPNDSDEYALLDQLLSQKLSGWLEQRFGNSLDKKQIEEQGFLPYYFNSLGGVFYSGKD